jgi:hypothetical protein
MWQQVPAQRLRPGDTVVGVGTLSQVFLTKDKEEHPIVVLVNQITHEQKSLPRSQMVQAYTVG